MPELPNPRHEAFARALFAALTGKTRQDRANSKAYLTAYPSSGQLAAESSASRLLRRAKVVERVHELLAEAAKDAKVTVESIKAEYDETRELAKKHDNHSVMLQASQAKAKLYKLETTVIENVNSETNMPKNSEEIALALLRDVGLSDPDDDAKARALQAYDVMVAKLEAIRDVSLGLTPYQYHAHASSKEH